MEGSQSVLVSTHNQGLFLLSPLTSFYGWLSNLRGPVESPVTPPQEPPYIASASLGVSIISQIRAFVWNDGMVQKGYEQHPGGIFKMPWMGSWVTVVSGKHIDEVVRAPESSLSFHELLREVLQLEHLFGTGLSQDQLHIPLIRNLTRNLDSVHLEIADETPFALEQELSKGNIKNEWVSVKATDLAYDMVLRLNLRAFAGLPLCRDAKWIKALQRDANDVVLRATILRAFPKSRRGDASAYLSRFGKPFQAANKGLTEVINERLAMPEEERPNNLLSWILSTIPPEGPDVDLINGVFQLFSVVAQNTTTTTLGHALLHLVANPYCIDILHEEIQIATNEGDITRESLNQMPQLDSFIRETQRLSGLSNRSIARVAMQDFYFSNGIRVPAGETIHVISTPVHHDPNNYPDPLVFKPWRFSEMAQAEGKGAEYSTVATSRTFLAWGLGKHACPGRWYAVMVIKHLLAHIILNYEIKLPDSAQGKRPADLLIGGMCLPNRTAQILFKRRPRTP